MLLTVLLAVLLAGLLCNATVARVQTAGGLLAGVRIRRTVQTAIERRSVTGVQINRLLDRRLTGRL